MAVKLIEITKYEPNTVVGEKRVIASLFADSKNDVTDGMEVIGMPSSYILQAGSSVITAGKDFAYLQSNGEWNWD